MSKEQTPITAEVIEILQRDYGWKNLDQQRTQELFSHILHDTISVCDDLIKTKVLEALERVQSDIGEWVPRHMRLKEKQFDEKEKQFTKGRIDCMMQISSHIETQVKPKYETQ